MPALLTRVDGVTATEVPVADRGLAYGDGLFETLRLQGENVPLLERHLARLLAGARCLGLPVTRETLVREVAAHRAVCDGPAILKLIVTRGSGGTGYDPAGAGVRLISQSRSCDPARWPENLAVRLCELRLARQPALAGLKHLNRLEQVLARREWDDPAIHEGLLRDTGGDLVEAVSANLFVQRDGEWLTPDLSRCGVAGVMRGRLLDGDFPARVTTIPGEWLDTADALFLCNSVRGIQPVTRCVGADGHVRTWPVPEAVQVLTQRIEALWHA